MQSMFETKPKKEKQDITKNKAIGESLREELGISSVLIWDLKEEGSILLSFRNKNEAQRVNDICAFDCQLKKVTDTSNDSTYYWFTTNKKQLVQLVEELKNENRLLIARIKSLLSISPDHLFGSKNKEIYFMKPEFAQKFVTVCQGYWAKFESKWIEARTYYCLSAKTLNILLDEVAKEQQKNRQEIEQLSRRSKYAMELSSIEIQNCAAGKLRLNFASEKDFALFQNCYKQYIHLSSLEWLSTKTCRVPLASMYTLLDNIEKHIEDENNKICKGMEDLLSLTGVKPFLDPKFPRASEVLISVDKSEENIAILNNILPFTRLEYQHLNIVLKIYKTSKCTEIGTILDLFDHLEDTKKKECQELEELVQLSDCNVSLKYVGSSSYRRISAENNATNSKKIEALWPKTPIKIKGNKLVVDILTIDFNEALKRLKAKANEVDYEELCNSIEKMTTVRPLKLSEAKNDELKVFFIEKTHCADFMQRVKSTQLYSLNGEYYAKASIKKLKDTFLSSASLLEPEQEKIVPEDIRQLFGDITSHLIEVFFSEDHKKAYLLNTQNSREFILNHLNGLPYDKIVKDEVQNNNYYCVMQTEDLKEIVGNARNQALVARTQALFSEFGNVSCSLLHNPGKIGILNIRNAVKTIKKLGLAFELSWITNNQYILIPTDAWAKKIDKIEKNKHKTNEFEKTSGVQMKLSKSFAEARFLDTAANRKSMEDKYPGFFWQAKHKNNIAYLTAGVESLPEAKDSPQLPK